MDKVERSIRHTYTLVVDHIPHLADVGNILRSYERF